MVFVFYLLVSFLVGCVAMVLSIMAKEDVGIFFDVRKWPSNSNMIEVAMFFGYFCMFGFALYYWIYRLCIFIGGGRR